MAFKVQVADKVLQCAQLITDFPKANQHKEVLSNHTERRHVKCQTVGR